ncbi:anthranilate synthase component I [Solemya velum gill symbiont]|uniref:anthranilate synthase component I n=1 Tax=Solemya velum gill symbiont TaxID=2340 RepID=UPI0009989944|nr:anthranilate synthase component I [Solemya velum gill symbiont]OOY99983.1 anthranilate synthase component I [Solemya velum gill symbiont]OOZ02140.1 anthranilate synthase component I [Solemya velum gill symbiont]OOZ04481.1 anthranilate synthase component I [Solemya velum gill symbiont]OOZ06724.1 anthranilate synthase component I [Solemya velum gill symbiont]OOZ08907.1 anthranilate synthase component I [Solemya velum gill symbiont]
MKPETFTALAGQGYNRIPVAREVLADLDTPLSVYLKLASKPYSYLFESVHGGEKWGRYSIIGLPCRERIEVRDHEITRFDGDTVLKSETHPDPLEWISDFQAGFKAAEIDGLPRFAGGLVGYFGYDTVRYIEPRLAQCPNPDHLNSPDILLMISDELVVFDNLSGRMFIIVHVDPMQGGTLEEANRRIDGLVAAMQQGAPRKQHETPRKVSESDFESGFTEEGFKSAVERIKEYILDGDCMQVVISQRLSIPFTAEPLDLYRALRGLNPSPYMYHLDLDDFHVVGSSPEILTRLEDGVVTVRPIAGTRRRGYTEEEDRALEDELLADPKELAEHLMLIDLGRNDAGRVAEIGSVELTEKMVVERYSHVMHIVSNVIGRLKPDMSAMDVIRATFPAGTVSGAPKIRAMEIIDELEPVKRGVYSGAVGYLAWNGNMDTAIAIRTAVIKDKTLHIQAGAGVVADSLPELEWQETMNKGRAVFRAVEMAEAGLDRIGQEGEE